MARYNSRRNIGFPAECMQSRRLDFSSAFLVREETSRVPPRRLLVDADRFVQSLRDTLHRNAFRPTNSPVGSPDLSYCFLRLGQQPEKRTTTDKWLQRSPLSR